MRWLFSILAGLVVLCLITLVMFIGIVNVPAGAAWITEKAFRGLIDPRIEIRGQVEIDLWPMLIVRAENIVIPAGRDDQQEPGCATSPTLQRLSVADAGSVALVLDWQQLSAKHIYVPVFHIDNLTTSAGLADSLDIWRAGSESQEHADAFASGFPDWFSDGWRVQIQEFSVTSLIVTGCSAPDGEPRLASARRLGLGLDLLHQSDAGNTSSGSLSGSATFMVDDLTVHDTYFRASVSRWLEDNGYLSQHWLRVDSARGLWTLEPGRVRLDSFQLVADGPNVEFLSGELDLTRQTLLFRFVVQAHRPDGAIRIPGVEIRLRQPSLEVLIDGDWSDPRVEFGGAPHSVNSEAPQSQGQRFR